METGIRIAEQGGPYHPLGDGDAIASDDVRLKQLGYKQELSRRLSYEYAFLILFFFFFLPISSFLKKFPVRSNGLLGCVNVLHGAGQ